MSSKKRAQPEAPGKPKVDWLKRIHAPSMLKAWREDAGLSQSGAASRFGLDLATYNAMEHGRKRPGIDIATRIQTVTSGRVLATQWAVPREARKGTPKIATRAA